MESENMASNYENNTVCSEGCNCKYKVTGPIFMECTYSGFCDIQRPRDSRGTIFDTRSEIGGNQLFTEEQLKFKEEFEPDRNG